MLTACGIETPCPSKWSSLLKEVATVLTACGIETSFCCCLSDIEGDITLQQCLPLAVLKPCTRNITFYHFCFQVATVLTACGIETLCRYTCNCSCWSVATVLTACGIETRTHYENSFQNYQLQQCLPLAVLKLSIATSIIA